MEAAKQAALAPIQVVNSRVHNLKNVSVTIPKFALTVVTGVSGSGKSSLAFDTIFAEAQRQQIETFKAFARSRLPKVARPDADAIYGLSSPISVDQRRMGINRRSTVGTISEISPLLRMVFSRCGIPAGVPAAGFSFNNPIGMCNSCHGLGTKLKLEEDRIIDKSLSISQGALLHSSFLNQDSWYYKSVAISGLFDLNKPVCEWHPDDVDLLLYSPVVSLVEARKKSHYKPKKKPPKPGFSATTGYISKKWEGIGSGLIRRSTSSSDSKESTVKSSSNNEHRDMMYFDEANCTACNGSRLNERARNVRVDGKSFVEVCGMEIDDVITWLKGIKHTRIESIRVNLLPRLVDISNIGLEYLSLDRPTSTLSGGESQRVKMARQLHCPLNGTMYVLDEPSIGLHAQDVTKIVNSLQALRDAGNTVIVVEHEHAVIKAADYIVEVGPESGAGGGNIVFTGSVAELKLQTNSATGSMLAMEDSHVSFGSTVLGIERTPRSQSGFIQIHNANTNNLKNVSVDVPMGCLVAITGVSGSGKSTLVFDELVPGNEDRVVVVDQGGLNRSSRSNPATWIGAFDSIRDEFAKATGSSKSFFSFNSTGACSECKGSGMITQEMMFLANIPQLCNVCKGRRFSADVLKLKMRGKSVADVLEMTISEAHAFFAKQNKAICKRLSMLEHVGLGYLEMGQSLSTLSGGEGQRLKLAKGLSKSGSMYILDEVSSGLHQKDIGKLMQVLHGIVDKGNGVLVIEHNLSIIACADYVIDIGPGGGKRGGEIVATGTPYEVAENPNSATGRELSRLLQTPAAFLAKKQMESEAISAETRNIETSTFQKNNDNLAPLRRSGRKRKQR